MSLSSSLSFFLFTLKGWHQLATTLVVEAMLPSLLSLELKVLANQISRNQQQQEEGKVGRIHFLVIVTIVVVVALFISNQIKVAIEKTKKAVH